jgi:hypothetical protein
MRSTCCLVAATVTTVFAATWTVHALAQNKAATAVSPPTVQVPVVAGVAEQLLKQMTAYIGSADQPSFHADVTFDRVLPTGQKMQFSARGCMSNGAAPSAIGS